MRDDRYAAAVEQIRAFAEQQMRENGAPGYQIALADRDGLIAHLEIGCANIDSRAPILPETMFEFGSIGKSFTAICYLQLAEAGRVDLHAPITGYLPWFSVQSVYEPITIHHLLTHTAGIVGGTDFTPGQEFEVWSLRNTATGTPPGTFYHYSNIGFKALGLALERIEGKPYVEIVQERIFEPLGMTNATALIDATIRLRLAVGYQPEFDDRPRLPTHGPVPAPWLETNTADGCLSASATDLAIYLRMLLNRGSHPGGRLISEESFRLITTSHVDTGDEGGYGYGYALAIQVDPPTGAFGHGGGMVGYVSSMEGNLDSGLGAVVFTNSMNATTPVALYALKALSAAQSGDEIPPLPEPESQSIGDFVGIYRNRESTVEFVERDDRLQLHLDGTTATLVKAMHYPDRFVDDVEGRRHFPYRFERDADGIVTGVVHGSARWLRKPKSGDDTAVPDTWRAYAGHYRSYDPWESNFRVVIRDGSLILIWPQGAEDELMPTGDGFRVGADPRLPERLWFDTIVDGQALRARDSLGSNYHRFFTP